MPRENAISALRLADLGITLESWQEQLRSGSLPGIVCLANGSFVGYCLADRQPGEIAARPCLPNLKTKVWADTSLRDTLLPRLISGQLRLPEAVADAVAEALA